MINLKDCESIVIGSHQQPEAVIAAIGELARQFESNSVDVVSLHSYRKRDCGEVPISYEILSCATMQGRTVVDNCRVEASHYIGRYANGKVAISVEPRYGADVVNYIVGYAANVYIPSGTAPASLDSPAGSDWQIALLWKAMLEKALVNAQIPKQYKRVTKNQRYFRGRLNVARHLRANMFDSSRIYCTYDKLSMDNTINRTVRAVYKTLIAKGLSSVVGEFDEYDKRLAAFGVIDDVEVDDLQNVNYTRLTEAYKPLMKISAIILKHRNVSDSESGGDSFSYFIDMAELWEMYLLKVLQRHLQDDYVIYSPNETSGDYLLDGAMREVRPDILVEKDGQVVAIIDAKYKGRYRQFGGTSSEGVSREDLYQMTAYLYHYSSPDSKVVGIFTAPVSCPDNDVHRLSHNPNHAIGLVNLNIDGKTIAEIRAEEEKYVQKIKAAINM